MHENNFRHMFVSMPKRLRQLSCRDRKKEFQVIACICRCHMFKDIWEAALGKELMCERESHIQQDRYAVAVKKNGTRGAVIGHLLRKIARVCSLFLQRGDTIRCTVIGKDDTQRICFRAGLNFPVFCISSPYQKKFRS